MTPTTWREMVARTRELEASLGDGKKRVEKNEEDTVVVQRRCIRASHELKMGDILLKEDLKVLRPCPADGIAPFEVNNLVGKRLKRNVSSGEYFKWDDIV